MMMRILAMFTGAMLLAASAHDIIVHAGGYGTPHAYITMALAAGIAIGSLAIGSTVSDRRYGLAALICIALLVGEAFALLATAERLVAHRDAAQAPIREAIVRREAAERRVAEAEKVLGSLTSERLQRAESAKAAADQAAIEKAAEKGCASNCRLLLEQQTAAADREVQAARLELAGRRNAAETELSTARAALAGAAIPPSPTPLADRLGVPPWALDLLAAALGSIAANGLAGCLLAFGGHGARHPSRNDVRDALPPSQQEQRHQAAPRAEIEDATPVPPSPREQAARFGVERLRPASDTYVPLQDIRAAYRDWCGAIGIAPLDDRTIGAELADLFSRVGLQGDVIEGRPVVRGVSLAPRAIGSQLSMEVRVR